jgi:hypothetical protein
MSREQKKLDIRGASPHWYQWYQCTKAQNRPILTSSDASVVAQRASTNTDTKPKQHKQTTQNKIDNRSSQQSKRNHDIYQQEMTPLKGIKELGFTSIEQVREIEGNRQQSGWVKLSLEKIWPQPLPSPMNILFPYLCALICSYQFRFFFCLRILST